MERNKNESKVKEMIKVDVERWCDTSEEGRIWSLGEGSATYVLSDFWQIISSLCAQSSHLGRTTIIRSFSFIYSFRFCAAFILHCLLSPWTQKAHLCFLFLCSQFHFPDVFPRGLRVPGEQGLGLPSLYLQNFS